MKRWILGLIVAALATSATTPLLAAGKMAYPPRFRRTTMEQTYVYKNRQGQIKTRQVYPGYPSKFVPPAYLYYGYPHSFDDTGIGFSHFP